MLLAVCAKTRQNCNPGNTECERSKINGSLELRNQDFNTVCCSILHSKDFQWQQTQKQRNKIVPTKLPVWMTKRVSKPANSKFMNKNYAILCRLNWCKNFGLKTPLWLRKLRWSKDRVIWGDIPCIKGKFNKRLYLILYKRLHLKSYLLCNVF